MLKVKLTQRQISETDKSEDELILLQDVDSWHIDGDVWQNAGMFSIHDDDTLDKYIPSSGPSTWMKAGYQSLLYPMLESLGMRGNLAVEGQRVGLTSTPPRLNDNGLIAKRLQDEKGWCLMAHSMTARYYTNSYYVDGLESPTAYKILQNATYSGATSNNTTSVYDAETGKQYSVNSGKTGWVETPREYIKTYLYDYDTKKIKMFNPIFPIDYQWGELFRLGHENGLKFNSWVTPGTTSSHIMVPLINEICPNGFGDFDKASVACNIPPLRSTVTRMNVEGLYLSGYGGEQATDNTFNREHFNHYKSKIDEAAEKGGWIIFALHAYRPCWVNSLPGALVSEGGTYPDEWVVPLRDISQYPDSYLDPPVEKGINDWSDWYPCPGTRLDMLWQLLKYAREKGLVNVTSDEGFEKIGNKISVGFYNGGKQLDLDKSGVEGAADIYPHYVVGANGERSYHNDIVRQPLTAQYTVYKGEAAGNQEVSLSTTSISQNAEISTLSAFVWAFSGACNLVDGAVARYFENDDETGIDVPLTSIYSDGMTYVSANFVNPTSGLSKTYDDYTIEHPALCRILLPEGAVYSAGYREIVNDELNVDFRGFKPEESINNPGVPEFDDVTVIIRGSDDDSFDFTPSQHSLTFKAIKDYDLELNLNLPEYWILESLAKSEVDDNVYVAKVKCALSDMIFNEITGIYQIPENPAFSLEVSNNKVTVSGLVQPTQIEVYTMSGLRVTSYMATTGMDVLDLDNLSGQFIIKVGAYAVKVGV